MTSFEDGVQQIHSWPDETGLKGLAQDLVEGIVLEAEIFVPNQQRSILWDTGVGLNTIPILYGWAARRRAGGIAEGLWIVTEDRLVVFECRLKSLRGKIKIKRRIGAWSRNSIHPRRVPVRRLWRKGELAAVTFEDPEGNYFEMMPLVNSDAAKEVVRLLCDVPP